MFVIDDFFVIGFLYIVFDLLLLFLFVLVFKLIKWLFEWIWILLELVVLDFFWCDKDLLFGGGVRLVLLFNEDWVRFWCLFEVRLNW